MIKIVMDVKYEPPGHKLYDLGAGPEAYTYQTLVARFVNPEVCREFFDAWLEWSRKKDSEELSNRLEKFTEEQDTIFIEKLAAEARKKAKWQGFPVNAVEIAIAHGLVLGAETFLTGTTTSGRCTQREDGRIALILNASESGAHRNFTAARELGRYLLYYLLDGWTPQVSVYPQLPDQAYFAEVERKINEFAMALLMPERTVLEKWHRSIEDLERFFFAPRGAVMRRRNEIEIRRRERERQR